MSTHSDGMPDWAADALRRLQAGDARSGLKILEDHANARDPAAMCALFRVYHTGWGVERSKSTARVWLTRAADLGYGPALFSLAELYARGDGVESSTERMIELSEKAGLAGDPAGYLALGLVFEQGDFGMTSDCARAYSYYRKAADQGSARGLFFLGRLYIAGKGVLRDTKKGFELFEQAAEADDVEALSALGELYESGHQGHVEDPRRSVEYYRRAARLGSDRARDALQRLPRVVPLGAISCSPGLAPLHANDRKYLIDRHGAAIWGDVAPQEWDRNDAALSAGREVQSVHRAGEVAVVIITDSQRRSTYMQLEGEAFESGHFSVVEGLKHAKELYEWWHFAKDMLGAH